MSVLLSGYFSNVTDSGGVKKKIKKQKEQSPDYSNSFLNRQKGMTFREQNGGHDRLHLATSETLQTEIHLTTD